MLKAYTKRFGITDRDQIRKRAVLDTKTDAQIRNSVLKAVTKMKGTVVMDTHASLKTNEGYYPGFSLADFEILKGVTKALIYVDAPNEDILERRAKDKTRTREEEAEWGINQHRDLNFALMAIDSVRMEAPIFLVMNRNNKLRQAQKRVQEIIKSMK